MTTSLVSVAALLAAMQAAGAAFPVLLALHNTVWRALVEPETGSLVPGAADGVPGVLTVEVRSADQFARILSNIEQINFINGFSPGEGLSIAMPGSGQPGADGGAPPADSTGEGGGQAPADGGAVAPAAQAAQPTDSSPASSGGDSKAVSGGKTGKPGR